MKRFMLSIIFVACFIVASAQAKSNIKTYFDKDFKPTKNKATAVYFRTKPVLKNGLYYINDFYKDGSKQWEGTSFEIAGKIYEGKCIWYNKDGSLNSICVYKNKLLKKTILYGAANYVRKIIESDDDNTITSVETFYANSQLKEKITFKPNIVYTTYYDNKGKIIGKNSNEDKNIVGDWITFNVEYGDGESIIGKSVYNQKYIETLTQIINSDNGKVYQETIRDGDTGDIVSDKSYINGK